MFVDICNERSQQGQDTHRFVYKIYTETLISVVTEQIQEVTMNIKTTKSKIVIGVSLVGIGSTIAVVALNNRPTAQSIQPGSWLKQVHELSKGKKGACLPNIPNAAAAVHNDDGYMEFKGNRSSNFETAAGDAIADVPAGTSYNMTINSYANNTAKGTLAYEKGYGKYNYTIQKLPAHGQWKLVSIIACSDSQ